MSKEKFVLFDFDGVIVDNFEMAYSFNEIVGRHISRKEYKDMFMGNVFESARKTVSDQSWEAHKAQWAKLYAPKVLDQPIQKGMKETIEELTKKFALIIVSSSVTNPIQEFLNKNGIGRYFLKVFGADIHESKEHKIQMIFDEFGTTAKDCVFITDTVGDVIEMKNMGIDSIAVLWGFHEKERFETSPPKYFANTPQQLLEEISSYFAA